MRRVVLPPRLVEQFHAFSAGGEEPAEPRDAATVMLLRNASGNGSGNGSGNVSGDGPEVYLLERRSTMAFAAGMWVFPGGGVDQRDRTAPPAEQWAGPSPAEWADRLGTDEATGTALVCAAVRETFEESGVLLAGDSADSVVADTTGDDWEADRLALEAHELAFTDFLARRGLVLRSDLLGVWSAWLTPVFEPRRYRTWFFVAALPEGQRTRDVSTESDRVAWRPVAAVLDEADEGSVGLMPPTYLNSLDVAAHPDVAAVLVDARERRVEMFTPTLTEEGGEAMLSIPERQRAALEARG